MEQAGLERNWSRHRPRVALNRPEQELTAPVDLLKLPFTQVRAVVRAFLAGKESYT